MEKMTPFITQGLLYDYLNGNLDALRVKIVDEHLKNETAVRDKYEKLKYGASYIEQLSKTFVSPALLDSIETPTTYFEVLLKNLRVESWSPFVRTIIEGVFIGVGITLISIFIPWSKLIDWTIGEQNVLILAELENDKNFRSAPEQEVPAMFVDEPKTETPSPAVPAAEPATSPSSPVAEETTAPPPAVSQGYLYRGSLFVSNLPATTMKLVDLINQLGGRKAGKVELGWQKNGQSSYFHFTMPESKYTSLLETFKQYGELKMAKEKHARVMPEGIIRLIVEVEERPAP